MHLYIRTKSLTKRQKYAKISICTLLLYGAVTAVQRTHCVSGDIPVFGRTFGKMQQGAHSHVSSALWQVLV